VQPNDAEAHADWRARRHGDRESAGVAGNARLTGSTAGLLFLLLAAEGATLLALGSLLTAHVFIGALLLPPTALKLASTGWKIVRYYTGAPAYQLAGPPPLSRRILGPAVIVTTAVVLGSGIALLLARPGTHAAEVLLGLHKASFIVWFVVMSAHVLTHLLRTAGTVMTEWLQRRPPDVPGRAARRMVVVCSLGLGLVFGVVSLAWTGPWVTWLGGGGGDH
jgi:hypothetical protein